MTRASHSMMDLGTPIMDSSTYTPESSEPSCLSPHALSETDLCGWLWMRSSVIGRWRHRYFSFTHGLLSYFESFPSEEFIKRTPVPPPMTHLLGTQSGTGSQPRGVLRVAHIEEINNKLGFKVYATSGKVIEIRAPRSDIRQTWLAALRATANTKSRSWSAHQHRTPSRGHATRTTDPIRFNGGRESIPIDKSGWLLKRSDILKRWNRYFFVIQDRMLSYYMTDKPYDVPRRRGYIESVRRDPKRADTIVVHLSAGGDVWLRVPKGNSPGVLDDWFDSLVAMSALHQTNSQRCGLDPSRFASDGSTDDSLDRSFI